MGGFLFLDLMMDMRYGVRNNVLIGEQMNCLEVRKLIVVTSKHRELTEKEKFDKQSHLESCKECKAWHSWLDKRQKDRLRGTVS